MEEAHSKAAPPRPPPEQQQQQQQPPYLWDAVLGPLRHRIGHREVVDHHDVLIGLIDRRGGLCARAEGGAAVLDRGSRGLDLRPLEKLGEASEEPVGLVDHRHQKRRKARQPLLKKTHVPGAAGPRRDPDRTFLVQKRPTRFPTRALF